MPRHFKIQWSARNFVLSHNGAGAMTTCGGVNWVTANDEQSALDQIRSLPGSEHAKATIFEESRQLPVCEFQREQILRKALRR